MDTQKIAEFQTQATELLNKENPSQKELTDAVTTFLESIKNNNISISAETTNEDITALVNTIEKSLPEGSTLNNTDKKNLTTTLQTIREKFKELVQEKKEEEADATEATKEATDNLKKEILNNLPGYSIADLQNLKDKNWKELWSDAKYMQSLQYLILASGAKDPSMDDRHLQDQIYGKVTKAGVITIQNYLNTTYQEKLNPD